MLKLEILGRMVMEETTTAAFMDPTVVSLLLGIAMLTLWLIGVYKGRLVGLIRMGIHDGPMGVIHRDVCPVKFWACAVIYGIVLLAVVVVSVVRLVG